MHQRLEVIEFLLRGQCARLGERLRGRLPATAPSQTRAAAASRGWASLVRAMFFSSTVAAKGAPFDDHFGFERDGPLPESKSTGQRRQAQRREGVECGARHSRGPHPGDEDARALHRGLGEGPPRRIPLARGSYLADLASPPNGRTRQRRVRKKRSRP